MWATRFQRRNFRPELKYFNFAASSRNSGQSALVFRSRSAGNESFPGVTGTSSVKVTELYEPTGDVINPNTRASVCRTSTTSMKQNECALHDYPCGTSYECCLIGGRYVKRELFPRCLHGSHLMPVTEELEEIERKSNVCDDVIPEQNDSTRPGNDRRAARFTTSL
ncbi:hypothetical protein EYF80_034700 [Liparis tanakae]|uniref:Uncharacterized protein n=1 Tax=Liparis tanakae TaxID=230148 RepID=A0A4Z2GNM4_9TELE|nr:hypothetical protein EYF80_034700 [Liparis tanakae]